MKLFLFFPVLMSLKIFKNLYGLSEPVRTRSWVSLLDDKRSYLFEPNGSELGNFRAFIYHRNCWLEFANYCIVEY